jgi:hypothetical protein
MSGKASNSLSFESELKREAAFKGEKICSRRENK